MYTEYMLKALNVLKINITRQSWHCWLSLISSL